MNPYNFAAAAPDEKTVFGACRPGHVFAPPASGISDWIAFMRSQGIERVCCLLDDKLDAYPDLLGEYTSAFGRVHTLHVPVRDFGVIDAASFHGDVLPFLTRADRNAEPVVVHCSAGSGRTGHVLALWLASERGYDLDQAIQTVQETGRSPLEAATRGELGKILSSD